MIESEFVSQMRSYLKWIQRWYFAPPTALKTKNEEPSPIREQGCQHSVTLTLPFIFKFSLLFIVV